MSVNGLTPPGSATYDSGTMYVGDGTWDSNDNTFLLPNLQGLNYATTRYNGMGNRFKDLPGYYSLILAHGVLAAMTFLFLVPIAIMINRFYWRSYYWKLRIHIWAQILTVLLTTAIFILGFSAVGPRRSLTNPHHSIGVALYVLLLVQFIGGYLNYKRSKGNPHDKKLLRIVLHHWLGRLIGLLGIIQVALGLTLYGSPVSLFILYAIAVFALVLAYFVFDFMNNTGVAQRPDVQASYVTGTDGPPPENSGHKFGGLLKGALAGGALAAVASRFRKKRRDSWSEYGSDVYSQNPSQAPSGRPNQGPGGPQGSSYVSNEKYSEYSEEPQKHTWRNRLLGLGALGGLGLWLSRRKKGKQESEYDGSSYYYSETSGGASLSRVEEGRPVTPHTPGRPSASAAQTPNSQDRLTRPLGHQRSHSDMSESSYMSGSPSKYRPKHPIRDGLFGLGAIGAAKGLFDWRKRRERKEQKRLDEMRRQEAEDEYLQRKNSKKFTGDGASRRSGRHSRLPSGGTASHVPESATASFAGPTDQAAAPYPTSAPYPSGPGVPPVMTGALPQSNTSLPPPPPVHREGTIPSTGSRPSTAGGLPQSFVGSSPAGAAAAGLAGGMAGMAVGAAAHDRRGRDNSRPPRSHEESSATPVSVKLNMHPDGRHVTLRRLTEEEAQKERESKRARNRNRRERADSAAEGSMMSDGASPDQRWRRQGQGNSPSGMPRPSYPASSAAGSPAPPIAGYPAVPRPSSGAPPSSAASPAPFHPGGHAAAAMGPAGMSNASLQPPGSVSTLPGRRPSGAGLMSHPGSVASPGVYDHSTDTGASQMSNYAENRRRRRAQRAQANLAKAQREGKSVDFE